MNEELQQALAEMITSSVAVAGDALAFTKEQLPEVVQQLLVWKMTLSIVWFSIGLLFLIASVVLLYKSNLMDSNIEYDDDINVGVAAISSVLVCIGIPSVVCNLAWLQIWLAPKVYLIEYAANLVR